MAFIATEPRAGQAPETLGVVRAVANPDATEAEFAIIVRSDVKGIGLGRALLEKAIRYCQERGIGELVGRVLPENQAMLSLARDLGTQARRHRLCRGPHGGFASRWLPEEGVVEVRLSLRGVGGASRERRRRGSDPPRQRRS
jgi:GNAT superfamily N-acetyltransferase